MLPRITTPICASNPPSAPPPGSAREHASTYINNWTISYILRLFTGVYIYNFYMYSLLMYARGIAVSWQDTNATPNLSRGIKKRALLSITLDPGPVSTESQPNNWHFLCLLAIISLHKQPTNKNGKKTIASMQFWCHFLAWTPIFPKKKIYIEWTTKPWSVQSSGSSSWPIVAP